MHLSCIYASSLCIFSLFPGLDLLISNLIPEPIMYINNSHKPTYNWLKAQIVNTFAGVRCYGDKNLGW